ncbi:hypothetical protein WA026_021749 [Henosepilachna vigintioctopunctata]|uniref:Uncharacterized protein n=1 Tax=Henosepilachna vigintioctopunctata TaxID=420089 RepID=A0AAW1TZE7_9CUCU
MDTKITIAETSKSSHRRKNSRWRTVNNRCNGGAEKYENNKEERYRQINGLIKRMSKGGFVVKKCTEIEQLENQHDSFIYIEKEAAGMFRPRNLGIVTNTNGNALLEID